MLQKKLRLTTNNVGITDIQQPLRINLYAIYIKLQPVPPCIPLSSRRQFSHLQNAYIRATLDFFISFIGMLHHLC